MGFRSKIEEAEQMLTFDDVYLIPRLAPVEPWQVDISSRASTRVSLLIPVVSSPMDTVTEYDMAVAMALAGGLGVVHRNMPVERQADIVRRVKEAPPLRLSRLYVEPSTACSQAVSMMRSAGVRELPVVSEGKVVGYVTYESLLGCGQVDPVAGHVVGSESVRVNMAREALRLVESGRRDAVAIIGYTGMYIGTLTVSDALTELRPNLDDQGRLRVGAAVSPYDSSRAQALDRYVDVLVSDVAHFDNANALEAARALVKEVSADFVAGNVGTYEGAVDVVTRLERLDGLRVGIAGGSICTTAEVGGAYAPTLWAVASVRDALDDHGVKAPIIADGGVRSTGDIVKALAAGASAVMLGYMLAGTDEAPAQLIVVGDRMYKPYRGMASAGAMAARYAADRYSRASKRVPEGVEGVVEYKGSVYEVMSEIAEGVKAGLGYAGARNIEELWKGARFGRAPKKTVPQELFKA